jgi:hypothetical protein
MRVIKIDLPAVLSSSDPEVTLASDEIRKQLFRELAALDYELSEAVRQRASSYFPQAYSVFARTRLKPEKVGTVTELWVVDPNIRWPAGLLTRRAWQLFIPVLSNLVRETMEQRLTGVSVGMQETDASVTVLAPTRTWRDPLVVAITTVVVTSLLWIISSAALRDSLRLMLIGG